MISDAHVNNLCGIPCKGYSQPPSVSLRNCCHPIVQLKSLWCQYYDSTVDSSINAKDRISSVSTLLHMCDENE